jgi:hypothetical protein
MNLVKVMASASQKTKTAAAQSPRPRGRPRNDGLPPGSVSDLVAVDIETGLEVKRPRGRPRKTDLQRIKFIERSKLGQPGKPLVKPSRAKGKTKQANLVVNQAALPNLVSAAKAPLAETAAPAAPTAMAAEMPAVQPQPAAAVPQLSDAPASQTASEERGARVSALPPPAEHSSQQDLLRFIAHLQGRVTELQIERDEILSLLAEQTTRYAVETARLHADFHRLMTRVEDDRRLLHDQLEEILIAQVGGLGLRRAA